MLPTVPTTSVHRRYARRLPLGYRRRAMLSIRVHENVRRLVQALAERRGMSTSEYLARLIQDHLEHEARNNTLTGLHP